MSYIDKHLEVLPESVRAEVVRRYSEPHRVFHTLAHVEYVLRKIDEFLEHNPNRLSAYERMNLTLGAIFHDIVYDPRRGDNEKKSAELFMDLMDGCDMDLLELDEVVTIINGTAIVNDKDEPDLVRLFNTFDRAILFRSSVSELLAYGDAIRKEYSHVRYWEFVVGHLRVIHSLTKGKNHTNIKQYEEILRSRQLRVAIFPGSFNPFHKGHLDVLNQARQVFDEVFVVRCKNPDKVTDLDIALNSLSEVHIEGVPSQVPTLEYTGMLDTLYDRYRKASNYSSVTFIKGIRNGADLDSELTQSQFVSDLSGFRVPYAFFSTAPELRHVSSSAIRTLRKFGRDASDYLP